MTPEIWNEKLLIKLRPLVGLPITEQLKANLECIIHEHRLSFYAQFGFHYLPLPRLNTTSLTIEGPSVEMLEKCFNYPQPVTKEFSS